MNKPDYRTFVNLSNDDIKVLADQQLAEAYTSAVLLNHRARMEGQRFARNRDPNLPLPEETEALKSRLQASIIERGKIWQISFTGESWLDPAPVQS